MMDSRPDLQARLAVLSRDAWAREEALLQPAVRADPATVARLLSPDFVEFGLSGRSWQRAETIAALSARPANTAGYVLIDRQARLLDADTVELTYRLKIGARSSRRTSRWRHEGERLRCYFHRGVAEE